LTRNSKDFRPESDRVLQKLRNKHSKSTFHDATTTNLSIDNNSARQRGFQPKSRGGNNKNSKKIVFQPNILDEYEFGHIEMPRGDEMTSQGQNEGQSNGGQDLLNDIKVVVDNSREVSQNIYDGKKDFCEEKLLDLVQELGVSKKGGHKRNGSERGIDRNIFMCTVV